jgi:hypothetical protein
VVAGLPSGVIFDSVSVWNGHLQLSGSIAEQEQPSNRCVAATLDTSTMSITRMVEDNCADPSLEGEVVATDTYGIGRTGNAELRIARKDVKDGDVTYGPPLFEYVQSSGTRPEVAYDGAGSMWVYEPDSMTGPIALRISVATGRVVQRATVPNLGRGLVVADRNGLYLAPASNSFGPLNGVVYEVPIGASTATNVDPHRNYDGYVSFFAASGQTVWVESCEHQVVTCNFSTFVGKSFTRAMSIDGATDFPAVWEEGDSVVGSPAVGYFTWQGPLTNGTSPGSIVRIDPQTGTISKVAPLTVSGFEDLGEGNAVVFDGALYIVEGSSSTQANQLVRVPL